LTSKKNQQLSLTTKEEELSKRLSKKTKTS